MKRFGKTILISLSTLVVLFVVGVFLLNRWLESPAMLTRIERELSKAMRCSKSSRMRQCSTFSQAQTS